MIHATPWMILKNIMLNERRQPWMRSKPLVKACADATMPQVGETDLNHNGSHSNCQVEQATRIKHGMLEGKSLWQK